MNGTQQRAVEAALTQFPADDVAEVVRQINSRKRVTKVQVYELVGRLVDGDPADWQALFAEPWTEGWSSTKYGPERAAAAPASPPSGFKQTGDQGIECKRCHRRETFFYQLQTRSGDEGMTTFYSCGHCSARWKG
jgi:DNA-directed RNA polymerase subunit M/transcription elongation factor TFIIS